MLYFLKQTFNMHESHNHSFLALSLLSAITIQIFDRYQFLLQTVYYVTHLTLTLFKAIDVTLKYARFLKIGNVALYQERAVLIVSKFQ